jgi:hypothetical protein
LADARDMADLILIAVSLTLATYYVIRLFKFISGQEIAKGHES